MAPPNLAADAPILDVLDPLRVNFFPMLREESDKMIAHHRERFFCFRITQKPLLAQPRLDRHFAALAKADVVFVRFVLSRAARSPATSPPAFFRASNRSSPSNSGTAGQLIRPSGCRTSTTGKLVALPISKSTLSCAGVTFKTPVPNSGSIASSATIGIFSRASGRQACLPIRSRVTLILRMNRHPGIGHDCFRTCRRDFEKTPRLLDDFVAHVIKIALLRLGNDFFIGQRGLRCRIPVDHSPAAINQTFLVKIDKDLLDRANVIVVESVTLP